MNIVHHIQHKAVRLLVAALFILPLAAGLTSAVSASSGGGAVYTLTNAASGNAVMEYARASDGSLSAIGAFPTGGLGSGSGLGSQGALVLSQDGRWLFAVNAGSSDISVFAVRPGRLVLVDRAASHGTDPISLTSRAGLLYVLDAGGAGNIAGFRVYPNGHLAFIPGSTRPLSNHGTGSAPSPEEIGFSRDGSHLVVSEKGSNLIDTYTLDDGRARGPVVNPSSGPAPYGFDFSGGSTLVISEAANSSVSSYKVREDGLKAISASVPDTQAAACWLVVTGDGKYAYAANAASGTISGYAISRGGALTLLRPDGVNGITGAGSHPIDMAFSWGDGFLYVLASGNTTINIFAVNGDGSLTSLGAVSSPAGASGLAAQ